MEKFKNISNTSIRIISAIIMLLGVFFIYKSGFFAILSLICVIAGIMVYEYDKMFLKKLISFKFILDLIFIVGLVFLFGINKILWNIPNYFFVLGLIFLFGFELIYSVLVGRKRWIIESLVPIYIGLPILAVFYIYMIQPFMIIYMFLITIMTDTGAYFIGSIIGGPKLCPSISPKKTWSGAIGGLISGFAFSTAYIFYLHFVFGVDDGKMMVLWGIIGIVLSFISEIGDLFESWIKRLNGIKDSSNIIPGHGGMLDRFDSLLFVAPWVAIIIAFIKVFVII